MMNILFIHKDSRVDALLARLREVSRIPINAVREFDHGLQEVFEKRPEVICIQEEIDGISCIAVAGHIKSLLRENAPRIFLLRNDPGRKLLAGRDCFDDVIELTGFGEDLLAEVRQRLDTLPGMQWRPEPASVDEGEVELYQGFDAAGVDRVAQELRAAVEAGPALPTDLSGGASEMAAAEEVTEFPAEAVTPILAVVSPVVPPPTPAPEPDRIHRSPGAEGQQGSGRNLAGFEPAVAVVPAPLWHEPGPESTINDDLPGFAEVLAGRRQRQRRSWLFAGSLLLTLLLAAGIYYLFLSAAAGPPRLPVSAPVSPPASVPPVPPSPATTPQSALPTAGVVLPPLLAAAPLDAGYGARKPGWERRLARDFELLVFREQGAMRAVQVIAREKTGLSAAVVAEVFQLAGGTAVDWRSGEAKGGLTVEQGVLPNRVEVLRYVRSGLRPPVALVVAWP